MDLTMRTYYWKRSNKVVAVNWVAGNKGQTHEHSLKEWEIWAKEAKEGGIELVNADKLEEELK